MDLVFKTFGIPAREDLDFGIDEDASAWISNQEQSFPPAGLAAIVPPSWLTQHNYGEVISLLEGMLIFNPRKRIKSKAALESPLFVELQKESKFRSETSADIIYLKDIEICPNSRTQLTTLLNTELRKLQKRFELSEQKGIVDFRDKIFSQPPPASPEPLSVNNCSRAHVASQPPSASTPSEACYIDSLSSLQQVVGDTKPDHKQESSAPAGIASRVWGLFFPSAPAQQLQSPSSSEKRDSSDCEVISSPNAQVGASLEPKSKYKMRTPRTTSIAVDLCEGGSRR